jgi:uncharacterized protein YchJ
MAKKGLKQKHVGKGRNDLCPCGSGIKYKKCCKPVPRMKTDEEHQADMEKRKKSGGVTKSNYAQYLQRLARLGMQTKQTRVSIDHGNLPDRVLIDER